MEINQFELYTAYKQLFKLTNSKLNHIDKDLFDKVFNIFINDKDEFENLNEEEKDCFILLEREQEYEDLMNHYKPSVDKEKIEKIFFMPYTKERDHLVDSLDKYEYSYYCYFGGQSGVKADLDRTGAVAHIPMDFDPYDNSISSGESDEESNEEYSFELDN